MRNWLAHWQVGLAAMALLSAAGCGREAGPSPEPKRAAAAAAAAASGSAPAGTLPGEGDSPSEGEKPEAAERAAQDSGSGLRSVTAAQLLAELQANGGKATLVNAWASWCGPCRREVPMLQALAANLRPQSVAIVLVSVDDPKDAAKASSFLKDNGITLKSYIVAGSIADFKQGIAPRWPGMLPASFLFDAQATLVHFWGGEAFENELLPIVEDFLAGRPVKSETRYGLAAGKLQR